MKKIKLVVMLLVLGAATAVSFSARSETKVTEVLSSNVESLAGCESAAVCPSLATISCTGQNSCTTGTVDGQKYVECDGSISKCTN